MANRTRPDQPARSTSSLEEWRLDRADARRLDPARYRKHKPEPPMTVEEIINHHDPKPPPDEGPVR